MMMNPSSAIKQSLSGAKRFLSILVSGLAFGLFFLQTGLDLYKTGQKSLQFVAFLSVAGFLYGFMLIPILAFFIWIILKIAKSRDSLPQVISTFCLSYSGTLVYGLLGFIFSIALGWKTSVAFGVTGVLWAIGPMIVGIREMTNGKNGLSVSIATIISAFVLLSWSILGNL